jgi:DNA-binding Lrp family transcriptional regulator
VFFTYKVEKQADVAVRGLDKAEGQKEEIIVGGGKQQTQQVFSQDEFSAEDLHGNDTKVLSLLNEEGSNYSFRGIMRKLHIHQQSLARALHRLEEMGLVEKSQAGYRLKKVGDATTAANIAANGTNFAGVLKGREYTQLLQTYIPVNIRPTEIVRILIGKWFRNLRWIGLIESGTGFTLQWASDDGSFQINLKMISEYIIIETNAATEREKLQAMVGSYAIYEQITKILQDRLAPANAYVLHRSTLHQNN